MKRLGVVIACLLFLACSDDTADKAAADSGAAGRAGAEAGVGDSGSTELDAAVDAAEPDAGEPDIVSRPGRYKGYSEVKYADGYLLSSEYVAVRDGTELAVDILRPKNPDGSVVTDKLPVLWMHTPYNRRFFTAPMGDKALTAETYPGQAARLIQYGYVVAVVDFRGLYASYGTNFGYDRGEWLDAARFDAYDITEWLAVQPWSTGEIGMWGCSEAGGSQLQAASTAPPHLKAIFPMSCEFDAYSLVAQGGIQPPECAPARAATGETSPEIRDANAERVDADADQAKLMAAVAQHAAGNDAVGYAPYRDSVAPNVQQPWWIKSSPSTYLNEIKASNIALYLAANWDEGTTKQGAFYTFKNVTNPAKLIVGPSTHCAWSSVEQDTGFQITVEELRFFDYALKGVANGVMDEPAVYYYTYNAPRGKEWASSDVWPLANERRANYYFAAVRAMTGVPPSSPAGNDQIVVDYDVNADTMLEKGWYYETPDSSVDVQVTGHPVVNLWVKSTATDGDFIALLQDVAPDGTTTTYNSFGQLRASHRKTVEVPPYDTLMLPYHPSAEADSQPLVPGEPTLLTFELLPTSVVFKKNHRIRVVFTFANENTPRVDPPPTVTIMRDAEHRSGLTLPLIPAGDAPPPTTRTM